MVGSFYDPNLEEGCAFEELISFHGGLGGPQTRPFILSPVELPLPDEDIVGAEQRAQRAFGLAAAAPGRRTGRRRRGCLPVNLVWSALIIVVAAALAVTAMLLVRRRAPEGSRFKDGDRASGVFGVLATGFSVLLGFVVFLAFESYDQSRSGAETEALVVSQQVETAQYFRAPVAQTLTGELVCYGRSVVHIEWPRMESGVQGDAINPWGVRLFRTFKTVRASDAERGCGLRKVDRPDVGPRGGPDRPDPRSHGRHPDAAVAGAVPHLRRRVRVHAVLRRQR